MKLLERVKSLLKRPKEDSLEELINKIVAQAGIYTYQRKVIVEKCSPLWNYNDPDNVPDTIWKKLFLDVCKLKDNHRNELYDYLARYVFCPLVKSTKYTMSPETMIPGSGFESCRQLNFSNRMIVNIPTEYIVDFKNDFNIIPNSIYGLGLFKSLIEEIWEKRFTTR